MKKKIVSIIEGFRKMMKEYDELYSEVYKDPSFVMMEGYTFACSGFYI